MKLDPAYAEEGIKYSNSILREGGSIYETYMLKYAGVDKSCGAALYYKDVNHYFDLQGNEISQASAEELGKGKYSMTTERVTTKTADDATKYECGSSAQTVRRLRHFTPCEGLRLERKLVIPARWTGL